MIPCVSVEKCRNAGDECGHSNKRRDGLNQSQFSPALAAPALVAVVVAAHDLHSDDFSGWPVRSAKVNGLSAVDCENVMRSAVLVPFLLLAYDRRAAMANGDSFFI